MKRGVKPKSAHAKLMTGNPGNRPIALDMEVTGEPSPVDELGTQGQAWWDRVVPKLVDAKIAGELDSDALTQLGQLIDMYVEELEWKKLVSSQADRNACIRNIDRLLNRIMVYQAKYRLTAADRAGVVSQPREKVSAMDVDYLGLTGT